MTPPKPRQEVRLIRSDPQPKEKQMSEMRLVALTEEQVVRLRKLAVWARAENGKKSRFAALARSIVQAWEQQGIMEEEARAMNDALIWAAPQRDWADNDAGASGHTKLIDFLRTFTQESTLRSGPDAI